MKFRMSGAKREWYIYAITSSAKSRVGVERTEARRGANSFANMKIAACPLQKQAGFNRGKVNKISCSENNGLKYMQIALLWTTHSTALHAMQ